MSDVPSPSSLQSKGSSSISRTYGNSAGKSNPILNIVNDYYTKQQAAYMQQRRKLQTSETDSSLNRDADVGAPNRRQQQQQPTTTQQLNVASGSSVLVSPPTASRNTSYPSLIDTSAISAQNMSTASARSTPPVERLLKWSEKREEALQRIREEEEKKKYAESTFRPNLAKARSASSSSVSSGGGGDAYYTHEQLHRSSRATITTTDANIKRTEVSVTERLLMQGQLSDLRKDFLRDTRNREIETQHPFQPVVLPFNSFRDPTAILQTTEAWDHKRGAIVKEEAPMDPECTFRPAINPPPPKRSNSSAAHTAAALSERSNNITTVSSIQHDRRSFVEDGSFQGTVLSAVTSHSAKNVSQRSHQGETSAAVSVSPLEDALVDELQRIRAACHSRGLHHGPHHSFTAFLASMCETTTLAPVHTNFQSSAFHGLRERQRREQQERDHHVPQQNQKRSTAEDAQPSRNERTAKANQVAAKITKRQQEKDSEVLRDLSPIHRFVVTSDEGVDEVSIGELGSGSESNRSRSGSSLRFEVEQDEESEFARTGSSTGMVILSEATPRQNTANTAVGLIPFDGFLLRQEQAYRAKQRRLEQLIRQTAPPLKPNICEHSRQLASVATKASTQKSNGDGSTTRTDQHRAKSFAVRSDELTFRPVITSVASNCPPRGFDDMHLDSHRRHEKLAQSAQKNDAEKMNECTFQPFTNRQRNTKVESTLNPRNFNLYQEQLARQRQQQDERRTTQERNAAMEEFSSCTFKPRVNRTPSYISRMTSSVSALREAAER